jgi:DNA-binding transcriptional regulator YiaG
MSTKVRTSSAEILTGSVSKAEFARAMKVSRQAVSTWIARKQLR